MSLQKRYIQIIFSWSFSLSVIKKTTKQNFRKKNQKKTQENKTKQYKKPLLFPLYLNISLIDAFITQLWDKLFLLNKGLLYNILEQLIDGPYQQNATGNTLGVSNPHNTLLIIIQMEWFWKLFFTRI